MTSKLCCLEGLVTGCSQLNISSDAEHEGRLAEQRQIAEAKLAAETALLAESPFLGVVFRRAGHYDTPGYDRVVSEHRGHYGVPAVSLSLEAVKFVQEFGGGAKEFALALPFLVEESTLSPIRLCGLLAGALTIWMRDGTVLRYCYCSKSKKIDAPPSTLVSTQNTALRARALHCLQTMPPTYIWNDGGMYVMQESPDASGAAK